MGQEERLGNYQPLLELASGGMATVYVARQLGAGGFQRLVVLKRVHRHLLKNEEFRDMFRDEARVAALIRHPSVVSTTDVVEADGELFLVMEYVESAALSALLQAAAKKRQRLPPGVVSRIFCDALQGLHAAHEAVDLNGEPLNVVHRDVSPQNILVGTDGLSRIIDFGVAKAERRIIRTQSGSVKGKMGYFAPEMARRQSVDRRADVFGAGVVLHEALTGKRLFQGEHELAILRQILEGEIEPPSRRVPELSPEIDAVVMRALAREPDERFATAAAFKEALEVAVPPLPAGEVKAVLETYLGTSLSERRADLRRLLDGSLEPVRLRSFSAAEQHAEWDGRDAVTVPGVSESLSGDSGASQPSEMEGDPPAAKPGVRRATIVFGVAATILLASAIAAVSTLRGGGPNLPSPATSPSSLSGAPPQGSTTAEVSLVLLSDQPFESVQVTGLRGVRFVEGRAELSLAPWVGNLEIVALFAGGKSSRITAESSGPRELTLPAPSPSPSTSASATASPSATASAKAVKSPSHGELHENPYGKP